MSSLLDKVIDTSWYREESLRQERRSKHYSHRFGPLQIFPEFKPMRDVIEVIAFAWIPEKVRVDTVIPSSFLTSLEDLEEMRRYSFWLVEQELLRGNYKTREECAEEMRLWREKYERS